MTPVRAPHDNQLHHLARRTDDWTGTRPLVSGAPVVIGVAVLVLAITVLVLSLGRRPGLPAKLSQEYTSMMAGSLVPTIHEANPQTLESSLASASGLSPHVVGLAPEFSLLGGTPHMLDGRRAVAWFYRSPAVDSALALAFEGRLEDLGSPDDVRRGEARILQIYRKTTQTIVCWQTGPLVYAFISTIPSERVIALAHRHAVAP
jgi:hypothetical protein